LIAAWDGEEVVWARECAAAGDSLEEIAAAAGRPLDEVRLILADLPPMSAKAREIASLYAAGVPVRQIDVEIGTATAKPGKNASSRLNELRRRGYDIPHRARPEVVEGNRARGYNHRGPHA